MNVRKQTPDFKCWISDWNCIYSKLLYSFECVSQEIFHEVTRNVFVMEKVCMRADMCLFLCLCVFTERHIG